MKKFICAIVVSMMSFAAFVQALATEEVAIKTPTIVVDTFGEPVIGAMVFDRYDKPIGIVDAQGQMPAVNENSYPITLRCMGFELTSVPSYTAIVQMKEATNELSEIVINRKERPNMYVVCYIKETCMLTDGSDSITWQGQFMADYMLPAYKGAKCKSWKKARELSREVKGFFNNTEIEEEAKGEKTFFLYEMNGPFKDEYSFVPDSLKGKTEGQYSVEKNGMIEKMYRLTPGNYTVTIDDLADFSDHKISTPFFINWAGIAFDITEFWSQHTYSNSDNGEYGPCNLIAAAYSNKIYGRGKKFKKIFSNEQPVTIYSYSEYYPVEILFLTKEEAQEIENNKPERAIESFDR